ncbi:MAG: nucleoside triphosphate pyrophosphohydrolase [Clostridia bacterium]|nr:nucleoside triphosphate pyrophosphohydrolase [Clostridia bacterium]
MEKKYTYEDLLEIVKTLRGEGGCPWDMEQTHQSIKHDIIEEGYELIEELDNENWESVADESGDLLLQIVFHAQIGTEKGEYNMDDVINAVCRKLVHRHPHVFGDVKVKDTAEVLENWAQIKRDDRGQKTVAQDMAEVSKYLPSLMRAQKIQDKAVKGGFVFSEPVFVADNIAKMMNVMLSSLDQDVAQQYIGKMLFEIVSVAKKMGVDAETALNKHTELFIQEYQKYED